MNQFRHPELEPTEAIPLAKQRHIVERRELKISLFIKRGATRVGADEQQRIARAGEGHVEQAQFLATQLATFTPSGEPKRQAFVALLSMGRQHLHAKVELVREQDIAPQILLVELTPKIRQHDHGKFEAFALVDRHQANGVIRLGRKRWRTIFLQFHLFINKAEEAIQPLPLIRVELPCEIEQSANVGGAFSSALARE